MRIAALSTMGYALTIRQITLSPEPAMKSECIVCLVAAVFISFPLAADDRHELHKSEVVAGGDMAVPEKRSKVLPQPVLDDRSYDELRDRQDSPRGYQLDNEQGQIRFGDGAHGRRPPTSG